MLGCNGVLGEIYVDASAEEPFDSSPIRSRMFVDFFCLFVIFGS
jgi:hypothetical protein